MGFVLPPLPPGGLSNLDTPTIGALTALRSQPLVWMFHGLWRARAPRHALTGWVSDLGGNRPILSILVSKDPKKGTDPNIEAG